MLIDGERRLSNLSVCRDAARHFLLSEESADAIIEGQITAIKDGLSGVMEEAELSEVDRRLLSQRVFLNSAVFESV